MEGENTVFKKTHLRSLLGSILIGAMAAISTPAMATNEAMLDLLKILRDKGSISAEEYELLANASKADGEKVEGSINEMKADVAKKTKDMPKITTKGKLKIESADGAHSFQPIGRIFWDSAWVSDDNTADVSGGSELRRARLGFQAQFYKNWKAKLEYDFSGSDADLKDGWISYNNKFAGGQKYNLKVGQHHVPFGFNTISSSKYMSFIRRPLFADGPLSPARQYGGAFRVDDKRWLLHTGFFLDEPEDGAVNVNGAGEDRTTLAVRVAGTPFMKDETHLMHVGFSYMYQDMKGDSLRVRQRAITHLDPSRMFDTGTFSGGTIDDVNAFDFEALGIYGQFHVLGEYVTWDMDNTDITDNGSGEDLSAWSIEGGWYLTGESMKYKKGQFSGVSPKKKFSLDGSGWGAWQVALRYENMDLNDGTTVGGDGDVLTVGLNWIPVKNIRFMAAYNTLLDFDQPGDANDGVEPSAFTIRSSVYW
jgi:phosphate-selective porin OprO and OprP